MSNEIVTISVPKGQLDNDYTFYADGKIKHSYDQSAYKLNQEAWITASALDDQEKKKILQQCPAAHKLQIAAILNK